MASLNKESEAESTKIDSLLRPKLEKHVRIVFYKEDERGRFYLLTHPQRRRNIKLNALGYKIVQMFDGNNSLSEIERELSRKGIRLDVYRFTEFLAARGFIENLQRELPDIEQIDTVKYPLMNPKSRWVLRGYHMFKFILSKPFLIFYVLFCGAALSLFLLTLPKIVMDAANLFHPDTPAACFIVAMTLFLVVEFLHEFSHAATYYSMGGTPQAIGFCYHFLIPFFYSEVPGIHLFTPKKSITVLLAGPLSTVFFGSMFVILHVFSESTLRSAWAVLSIACFFSALFTLAPFVKTDGYYLLESLLRFPNFHTHALRNIFNSIKRMLGFISRQEHDKLRSRYSKFERRFLDIYCVFLPFGMFGMIYVSVFMALQVAIPSILAITSQLKSIPELMTPKAYVFLLVSFFMAILILHGVVVTITRAVKRRKKGSGLV